MKGMKYHDYIWDLGGTLLDNYETSTAAFVETLAEFGIEQEHDSVYEALKVSPRSKPNWISLRSERVRCLCFVIVDLISNSNVSHLIPP